MTQPRPTREPRYADSHVHLDRYDDAVAAAMVARARAAGVVCLLTVGVDSGSSRRAAALAARLPGVRAAAGLHPRRVRPATVEEELAAVAALATPADGIVAVGEVGLDRTHTGAPLHRQRAAFAAQLELAAARGLPVVVHSVGAHAETAVMLAEWRERLPAVIVHYFTGTADELRRFLALDCHVSFGRPLLKAGQEALRAVARLVPAGRLLAETDTYPLPGRRTEPRDVVEVVQALAAVRDEPRHVTAAHTLANLRRLVRARAPGGQGGGHGGG
jgi:TatD DNase family protein